MRNKMNWPALKFFVVVRMQPKVAHSWNPIVLTSNCTTFVSSRRTAGMTIFQRTPETKVKTLWNCFFYLEFMGEIGRN